MMKGCICFSKKVEYFDSTDRRTLNVLVVGGRTWLGIHCLSSSSCHDAFSSDMGDILFHYDYPPGTGQ